MVNYNLEEPKERGFWIDSELENCKIIFLDEIFAIEKTVTLMDQISESKNSPIAPRGKMPNCTYCKDRPNKKCKICSCHICGGKDSPEKQILCDECDLPYHLWCLKPHLIEIPEEDDW
ncbi:e3 ubiquitin-protein ligase UHRF1 [Caerostris extrusa]|uniref:E3 ubiquitin-protein ligase UHRF1 n=1 Tax=Caerostris extrusa TaxID=172846 RepID=A0AAV4Y014_CAEEX|nr:e3 ubiquitin-protein ligase UHRF1 [Caerostris extrusa]